MQIFRLSPASIDAPEWNASTYKGTVLVRAETEDDARQLACDRYWIATRTARLAPPWARADLVQAQVLAQPRHSRDGHDDPRAHRPDLTGIDVLPRAVRTGPAAVSPRLPRGPCPSQPSAAPGGMTAQAVPPATPRPGRDSPAGIQRGGATRDACLPPLVGGAAGEFRHQHLGPGWREAEAVQAALSSWRT
jgi:hypothetical protein